MFISFRSRIGLIDENKVIVINDLHKILLVVKINGTEEFNFEFSNIFDFIRKIY